MIHNALFNEMPGLKLVEEIACLMALTSWEDWKAFDGNGLTEIGHLIETNVHGFLAKLDEVSGQFSGEIRDLREKAGIGKPEPDRTSNSHPEGQLFNRLMGAFQANDETWQKIKAILEESEKKPDLPEAGARGAGFGAVG